MIKEVHKAKDIENDDDIIHALKLEEADIEAKLKLIDNYKTEGLILQSRCRWKEKVLRVMNTF